MDLSARYTRFLFGTLPLLAAGLVVLSGCFGSSDSGRTRVDAEAKFPEGDPSVAEEDGGPGFAGEGWQTAAPGPLGDPDAEKGGIMTTSYRSWPENLRIYGSGNNTFFNSIIESLCYESLLGMHPTTLEPIPRLATHWQILDDNMKFRFRLNPKAHWSDGQPVTADDVIATYRLVMDDSLVAPNTKAVLGKLKEPKKISKYIIEVECKERNWRNFQTIYGLTILPAHQIAGLKGTDYINKYSGKLTATSGPYILYPSDLVQNRSITLTRRADYWGNDLEMNQGLYNFAKIKFEIVRKQRLQFDKALKGDIDFHPVYTAEWWVQSTPTADTVKKGHVVAQKIFNKQPQGSQGMAFNMREPPLDDVRVRKALAHLFNREMMIEKFAYNAYEPLKSYFPNSDAENPDNELVEYNPGKAIELLSEAGFTERGRDGILMRGDERLSLTITYSTEGFGKYFTTYQQDCLAVGVEIVLELVDPEVIFKRMMEGRRFQITNSGWTGSLFPFPVVFWYSEMADQDGSNNIVGFKNERADELIEAYQREFDLEKRNVLLRELDAVIFNEHPTALQWYAPSERILYLNKFGMPDGVFTKYGDWSDAFAYWWVDPDKAAALRDAKGTTAKLPTPPAEVHYWAEHEVEAE